MSDKDIYIDNENKLEGKNWWDIRTSMILVPPQSWSKIKAFIIKTCKQNNQCDQVKSWDRKINKLDTQGK